LEAQLDAQRKEEGIRFHAEGDFMQTFWQGLVNAKGDPPSQEYYAIEKKVNEVRQKLEETSKAWIPSQMYELEQNLWKTKLSLIEWEKPQPDHEVHKALKILRLWIGGSRPGCSLTSGWSYPLLEFSKFVYYSPRFKQPIEGGMKYAEDEQFPY